MNRVPVITSPCPFRWSSMPKPGQDFCGQCKRQVHNLDLMSAEERQVFMQSCSGEVCVSYTVRRPSAVRNIALGLGLAASGIAANAAAQDVADTKVIESRLVQAVEDWKAGENEVKELTQVILLGGTVNDTETSRWVDESEIDIDSVQELPQTTEMQWLETPGK